MAARRKVSKKKHGRKPPLHIVSDFGTRGNSPLAKRIGNDKKLRSKGNYGAK
jgi:hypothetical protein